MSENTFGDQTWPFECPECGHVTEVKANDVRPGHTFVCRCGNSITLSGDDIAADAEALAREIFRDFTLK